ncbi:MAG: sensor histidine kinase [Clostridium sp.]|nr:sensor histidine kinase [Clostridium sp.]
MITAEPNQTAPTLQRRLVTIAIHLLVLTIVFVLPEIFISRVVFGGRTWSPPPHVFLTTGIYIVVFYIHYLLVYRALDARRYPKMKLLLLSLLTILVATALIAVIDPGPSRPRPLPPGAPAPSLHSLAWIRILREFGILVMISALAIALRIVGRWRSIERRSRELVAAQRGQELDNLKSQLNPHFLFNTMNAIYALIDIDPGVARKAVYELSRMLRYVLYCPPEQVSLGQEIEFVERYVYLMRLRLPADVALSVEIDDGGMAKARIAPLVFITLVENLFKHGRFGTSPDTVASIRIECSDGIVSIETDNLINDNAAQTEPPRPHIGLANLCRRLALLYGSDAELRHGPASGGRFVARLSIKLGKSNK